MSSNLNRDMVMNLEDQKLTLKDLEGVGAKSAVGLGRQDFSLPKI